MDSLFFNLMIQPLEIALVKHPYPINGVPLVPVTAPEEKFAVFSLLGKQFKVTKDDVIVTDKIENIDIGQKLEMNEVALVGSRKATLVGAPLVQGARVVLEVEEITKDKKVIIFKSRRRKNSKSKNGFRRLVTILRVTDIVVPQQYSSAL